MHRIRHRAVAASLLALVLALPLAAQPASRGWEGTGILSAAWEWLAPVLGLFQKIGSGLDLLGNTETATPSDDGEGRGHMDPDGATADATLPEDDGERRGTLDPNG